MTVCKARARDDNGAWQSKRFPVTSWHRDGSPVLPPAAEEWARSTRRTFLKGDATAGAVTFRDYAHQVADILKSNKVKTERERLVRAVGDALDAEGVRDMKADSFATRVRVWLDDLKTGWCADPEAPNRRKNPKPLSPATRNKLLIICRQVTGLAVMRRKLAFDPLVEIERAQEDDFLKPVFSIEELRRMVSDDARDHNAAERRNLEDEIALHGRGGLGRTDAIKAVAAARGVHWCSVYNALARPLEPDPWWLACCLLVYTGCRADEGMHLRWEWVKWAEGVITLKLTDDYEQKTNSERLIPLEPELADILRPLAKPAGHILPAHVRAGSSGMRCPKSAAEGRGAKDYTGALRLYLARIGVDAQDRTAHSLRHNFISVKLARSDMNPERLRKAVGHASFSTTQGYANLSQLFEAEVDRWPDRSLWLRRPVPAAAPAAGVVQ